MDPGATRSDPDPWAHGDTIATLDWESGRLVCLVDLGQIARIRYWARSRKCPRCVNRPCLSGFCAGFEPVTEPGELTP